MWKLSLRSSLITTLWQKWNSQELKKDSQFSFQDLCLTITLYIENRTPNTCLHFTFPNVFPTVQHHRASTDAKLNCSVLALTYSLSLGLCPSMSRDFFLLQYSNITWEPTTNSRCSTSYFTSESKASFLWTALVFLSSLHGQSISVFIWHLNVVLDCILHFICQYPTWAPRRQNVHLIYLCVPQSTQYLLPSECLINIVERMGSA